jgi:hypothetical protein
MEVGMAVDFDERKIARDPTGLWLGWALATMVGLVVGYLPAALIIGEVDLGIARVLVPILAGVLIGLAQWLVLRRYLTESADWVFNLTGSWVVGYVIALLVVDWLGRGFWSVLFSYILFGVIVALFQWPVLRREVPQIGLWVIANVLGWTVGALASQLVIAALFGENPASLPVTTLVNALVVGLVAGVITGLALVRIVRQPERPVALRS